jgi:predicted ribosome quality control (RQC) complex YloA/Tae2 family protein
MIPPMKSLTVYALGLEMDNVLRGSIVSRIDSFFGGATLYLEGTHAGIWHLLYFGSEPELITGRSAIIPPEKTLAGLPQLRGGRIGGVKPLGMGRVLVITVEIPGGWNGSSNYLLRLDLSHGRKTATLYSGAGGGVVDTLGTGRSRAAPSAETSPTSKPLSILQLPHEPPVGLLEAIKRAEADDIPEPTISLAKAKHAAMWLLDTVEGIDPALAREITRGAAGGPVEIWTAVRTVGSAASKGEWSWGSYGFARKDESILYPVELPFAEPTERYESFFDALSNHGERYIIPSYSSHLKHLITSSARKEIRRIERITEHVSGDISRAERSKEFRHFGNLLVTYRHRLKRGMKEISVLDFSGTETLVIPLDPTKAPDKNIESYFKRAKKGERGIMVLRSRRLAVEAELEERKRVLDEIQEITDPSTLISMLPRTAQRRQSRRSDEPDRFRRFELEGGLTAFVGRSGDENDRLTHRFASPSDLWFHAQGISGSHVILKGADRSTPKRVLEQAAAIAAHFSKARHSTTVPVIYAEKRYVRKPRNSKPGTAVCQRGKTLFVRPVLPEVGK